MAEAAAAESESEPVLAALAHSHPAAHVRCVAIGNRALGSGALVRLAAVRDGALSLALLERQDLPADATAQVVETLLLEGVLDHHAMHVALQRPDFPERLLETVVMRLAGDGTAARIELAREMHVAPPHRRDEVHIQLLRGARRIKSTGDLIDAVIGPEERRTWWLAGQEDGKLQSLMVWHEELRRLAGLGNEKADEPAAVAPPASVETSTRLPVVALTGPAVSARLRRWWLHEAMRDRDLLISDLGEALADCKLVRSGCEVQVQMPFDFGLGSPIELVAAQRLTRRVAELSAGAVRQITWQFNDYPKATTRKRSSNLDLFEPGDPPWDAWAELAAHLAREFEHGADDRALTALGRLRLAGVSRHRVWLALPTPAAVLAVGNTPGAAATLKVAVAKIQKRKPEEALYSVVTDPSPDTLALYV